MQTLVTEITNTLQAAFPNTTFTVVLKSHMSVSWQDGPTLKQMEASLKQYKLPLIFTNRTYTYQAWQQICNQLNIDSKHIVANEKGDYWIDIPLGKLETKAVRLILKTSF